MPRPRPQQLVREVSRHGKVGWYVRARQGKRTRLREHTAPTRSGMPTGLRSPGRQGKAGPKDGTLAWLIGRYVRSAEWSDLSAATRKQRHAIYRTVEATAGDRPIRKVDGEAILRGRDRRQDRPHAASNFLKAMRGLFGWAVIRRLALVDPTKGIKLLIGQNDDVGFHAWTEDELARFETRWPIGPRQRLAFDLLLYTGLRRGDAMKLGRQHVRGGEFSIRTEKTGATVTRPILRPLAASIAATITGGLAFLITDRSQPFESKESFGT